MQSDVIITRFNVINFLLNKISGLYKKEHKMSVNLEKNEYRYCEQGQVIFFFDLGKPKPFNTCHSVLIPEGSSKILTPQYPSRFLRFTASLGNKTFINVKAISQDEPFIDDTSSG